VETHTARDEREQSVVLAKANACARINLGAALTDDNVATDDAFATEFLNAKTAAC
jgi:hypothetical protein